MWAAGRQGTGYHKWKIFSIGHIDCYILRYREGAYIPPHTDPVEGFKHHRINIELKRARRGGSFIRLYKLFLGERKRITYFRPDLEPHTVSSVLVGSRYVLSIGWLTSE